MNTGSQHSVEDFVANNLGSRGRAAYRTAADELREEGWRKGRAEGLEEGSRQLLRSLLQQRFGLLPADALARLDAADRAQLDAWAGRLFEISRLEQLFESE
ncbi:MAG: hypothetical protein AAGC55_07190 [Myxococcota bacterium]